MEIVVYVVLVSFLVGVVSASASTVLLVRREMRRLSDRRPAIASVLYILLLPIGIVAWPIAYFIRAILVGWETYVLERYWFWTNGAPLFFWGPLLALPVLGLLRLTGVWPLPWEIVALVSAPPLVTMAHLFPRLVWSFLVDTFIYSVRRHQAWENGSESYYTGEEPEVCGELA